MNKRIILSLLILCFVPSSLLAQPSFYGRASGGLGLSFLSFSDDGAKARATGLSLPLDFAGGLKVAPDLAVQLELLLTPVLAGGGEITNNNSSIDLDELRGISWFLGVGAVYFFSTNGFVSGSLGLGKGDGSIEADGLFGLEFDLESDVGAGLTAQVGWLFPSGAVDLGVSGLFHFMSLPPDVGDASNTTYVTIGALFSVHLR